MARIGIDFGTTNSSLVAYNRTSGEFEYFGSESGRKEPTPSVVWYHDNRVDVGRTAKENYNKYCDVPGHHMETSVKSKFGLNEQISIFGRLTEPHYVAAEIIKHLKAIAVQRNAAKAGVFLDSAVYTIPVCFSGKQRMDLRKASEAAGIAVETFIHEPFAALIGYLFSQKEKRNLYAANNSYILVFDWGGGTLDITIVKVENEKMYEVGTSELSGIAGDKFDDELALLVKNKFIDKYGSVFDPEYIYKMLDEKKDRIISNAEKCKIELSQKTKSEIFVEDIIYDENTGKSYDIDETICRTDFEKCIQHHINAASNRIEDAIRAAGISHEQVSFVLMTGGTSNIPLVRASIENKFGSRVRTADNPDMVIAQGAAVVAEMEWTPYLSKNIMVELSDGSYWTAFPEGMPLVKERMPEREEVFTCIDTRDIEAKLIIVEGNMANKKDRNLAIVNVPVNNVPSLRSPDDVVIDFSIDENIVLTVKGYGKQAGKRKRVEIYDVCFGVELR
ncbi:MAG: Hsp70 family protein [Clostridia bacterium]|nr:Hsp70 family protein [Clostridia bacterium]